MSFSWTNVIDGHITYSTVDEIKTNIDTVYDNLSCTTDCPTNNTSLDSTVNNGFNSSVDSDYNSGYDNNDDVGYDGSYNSGYDGDTCNTYWSRYNPH